MEVASGVENPTYKSKPGKRGEFQCKGTYGGGGGSLSGKMSHEPRGSHKNNEIKDVSSLTEQCHVIYPKCDEVTISMKQICITLFQLSL